MPGELDQAVEGLEIQEQEIQDNQEPEDNSIEVQAREMGWKPLDEFNGDPEKHIPADKFVKRGLESLPILQKNYKEVNRELREVREQLKATKEYQEHIGKVQYERALKELTQKQREAVEAGDTDAYDKIEKEKETVKNDYSPKQSDNAIAQIERQETLVNWKKENDWYQSDPLLREEADAVFHRLSLENPSMDWNEKLTTIARRVKEANPSKFHRVQAKLPAIEGTRESSKQAAKTWNDIPAADRATGEMWVRKGVLSREQYVKDYFGE